MSTSVVLNRARELAQELDHQFSTLSDCQHTSWHSFCPNFPLKHTSRVTGESTHPTRGPLLQVACTSLNEICILLLCTELQQSRKLCTLKLKMTALCFSVCNCLTFILHKKCIHYFRQHKLKPKNSNCLFEQESTTWRDKPNSRQYPNLCYLASRAVVILQSSLIQQ